jgi:hypothetical protein
MAKKKPDKPLKIELPYKDALARGITRLAKARLG